MDKKIIFLDIDGTIMTFQGKLPESAKQALMLAKEAGHSLVLCSGRTKSEIYPELLEMNFDGIIGAAGAYVRQGEALLPHSVPLLRPSRALALPRAFGALSCPQKARFRHRAP